MSQSSVRQKSNVIQEVFLSPRVIDREAFNDYSGALRKLIEEAAAQTEALKAAAAEAQAAQQALQGASTRHQGRIDAAGKALAAIEHKTAEADRLLQSAREARTILDALRAETDKGVQGRLTELNGKIEQMQRRAEENVRLVEKRATESVLGLIASAERKLAQVEAGLIEFKSRAEPLPSPVTATSETALDRAGADAAGVELNRLIGEAERQRESGASVLVAISQAAESAEARTRQLRSLHEQSEMAKTGLMDTITNGAARIDELLDKAEGVRKTAAAIAPACEAAEQRTAETLRRIETAGAAGEGIITQTTAVAARLEALLERLQPWAGLLAAEREKAPGR
jgi:chromosome segregation ATPase